MKELEKEQDSIKQHGARPQQEFEIEMQRLLMVREDKLSRDVEEFAHRERFKQKDKFPPPMPPYFTDDLFKQVFKNKPVQRTPVPGAPTSENFLRHRIGPNVQLP